jgi:Ca2+-binding RTX toxin-like protein
LTDPDSTDLGFELASNSNPGLVADADVVISGSGSQRTIAITATSKRSGAATLAFEVSDATSTATLVLTVRVGTDVNETLTGTEDSDVILGLGGRDTINALGGDDVLCGANGDDTLNGGAGGDVLDGGKGSDALTGGAGGDRFSGGAGADVNTDFDVAAGDTSDGS